jgi:hypothetical protein
MSFEKKKKVVVGTIAFALGCGGVYQAERVGFEENFRTMNRSAGRVVALGDTGEKSKILDRAVALVDSRAPDIFVLLGDEFYPDGIRTEEQFIEYIAKPFYRPGRLVIFVGGNHTQLAKNNRDFLLELARSGKYKWFVYDNYYTTYNFDDVCIQTIDSAVHDVKISGPEKSFFKRLWNTIRDREDIKDRQEWHVLRAITDARCEGKPFNLYAHHHAHSPGKGHGDRKSDRYTRFLTKVKFARPEGSAFPKPSFAFGHDHISYMDPAGGYFVVGLGAKSTGCARALNKFCFEVPGVAEFEAQKGMSLVLEEK